DPEYGVSPAVPRDNAARFRVFKSSLAAPPQMWSTHPANADREENAKRRYVAASIDARSAWSLFDTVEGLKAAVTCRVLGAAEGPVAATEELLARLEEEYALTQFCPRYRGAYLGRSTVRHAQTLEHLYAAEPAQPVDALRSLYPETLAADL